MNLRSRSVLQTIAATAVLGIGGAALAVNLPPDSVGRAQLKDDAVNSARVQDKTLTGEDIQSRTLSRVPKAKSAKVAGKAFTTANKTGGPITATIPAAPTTFASLKVRPGSYVVTAKAQIDTNSNQDIVGCDLVAGTTTDQSFVQGPDVHASQILVNTVVATFAAPGVIELKCSKGSPASVPAISQIRLTAMSVRTVVNQP
jgi:hypothetical protein